MHAGVTAVARTGMPRNWLERRAVAPWWLRVVPLSAQGGQPTTFRRGPTLALVKKVRVELEGRAVKSHHISIPPALLKIGGPSLFHAHTPSIHPLSRNSEQRTSDAHTGCSPVGGR